MSFIEIRTIDGQQIILNTDHIILIEPEKRIDKDGRRYLTSIIHMTEDHYRFGFIHTSHSIGLKELGATGEAKPKRPKAKRKAGKAKPKPKAGKAKPKKKRNDGEA